MTLGRIRGGEADVGEAFQADGVVCAKAQWLECSWCIEGAARRVL